MSLYAVGRNPSFEANEWAPSVVLFHYATCRENVVCAATGANLSVINEANYVTCGPDCIAQLRSSLDDYTLSLVYFSPRCALEMRRMQSRD